MVRCHCLLQESTCDSVRHVTCNQKLDTDVLGANRGKGMAAAHICRRCCIPGELVFRSAPAATLIMLRPLILVLKMMDNGHENKIE